jgi:hypothetical protein
MEKQDNITIKADGSIRPVDTPLKRNGNIYVLTADVEVSGNGIIIEKDGILLDGSNYILKGVDNRHYGICLSKRKNVTIENIWIQNFHTGIWLRESFKNRIMESIIEDQ